MSVDKHKFLSNPYHLYFDIMHRNWKAVKGYIYGYFHPITKKWFGGKIFNRNRF